MGTGAEHARSRARARKLILVTAIDLMQKRSVSPSLSDIAEAAGVSHATAYRYFPSQAAIVHAAVNHGLGRALAGDENGQCSGSGNQKSAEIRGNSPIHTQSFQSGSPSLSIRIAISIVVTTPNH